MIALNNKTSADGYTQENTVLQAGSVRVTFHVGVGAAIYTSFADPDSPSGNLWQEEVFRAPGHYSLDRLCSGARFRSAVAGTPVQVTLELLLASDVSG